MQQLLKTYSSKHDHWRHGVLGSTKFSQLAVNKLVIMQQFFSKHGVKIVVSKEGKNNPRACSQAKTTPSQRTSEIDSIMMTFLR